jgi:hypothetical protein
LQSLVTVGSLGCVFVFRDAECAAERGYILVGASPTDEDGEIRIGYFRDANYNPAGLAAFRDAASAAGYFERCLAQHDFLGGDNA